MTWTILHAGAALLVWITALDNLRTRPWRPENAIQRANCLTLMAVALCFTIMLPPVYATVDRLTGAPNLAKLLADSLAILGPWAFSPVMTQLVVHGVEAGLIDPHLAASLRARHRVVGSVWLLAGTGGLLIVLFVLAPVHQTETPGFSAFQARYGGTPFIAEYTFALLGYLGLAVYNLLLLAQACTHLPTAPLRLRAQLQVGGWAAALVLMAHECLYVAIRRLGIEYPIAGVESVRHSFLVASIALLMSGGFIDLLPVGDLVSRLSQPVPALAPGQPPRAALRARRRTDRGKHEPQGLPPRD